MSVCVCVREREREREHIRELEQSHNVFCDIVVSWAVEKHTHYLGDICLSTASKYDTMFATLSATRNATRDMSVARRRIE